MINVNNVETTVLRILKDSKTIPHKFSMLYTYNVDIEDLDTVCFLLLYLGINVIITEITEKSGQIQISHTKSGHFPKLKILVCSKSNETDEFTADTLIVDEDIKSEILGIKSEIITKMKFD